MMLIHGHCGAHSNAGEQDFNSPIDLAPPEAELSAYYCQVEVDGSPTVMDGY